jgi:hypothetical protein
MFLLQNKFEEFDKIFFNVGPIECMATCILLTVETMWQDNVNASSTVIFHFSFCIAGVVFSKKILICCVIYLKCSSYKINSKNLIKFSLMSVQLSVWPHASLILYHLFGISSSGFGNMYEHTLSSLYPILHHSFSQQLICSTGL